MGVELELKTEAEAEVVLPPALLFQIILFVTVGEEEELLTIPPPLPLVDFPEKVLFVTVGKESMKLNIPPPSNAEFPEKMLFVTVGEEE